MPADTPRRSVGEKWADNAYSRGRDEEHEQFIVCIEAATGMPPGGFAAKVAKIKADLRPRVPTAEQQAYFDKLEKAGAMMSDPALEKYDLSTRARLSIAAIFGDDCVTGAKATAQGIVRAGRMRRAEIETPAAPRETEPDVQVSASQILRAAKKARGELN